MVRNSVLENAIIIHFQFGVHKYPCQLHPLLLLLAKNQHYPILHFQFEFLEKKKKKKLQEKFMMLEAQALYTSYSQLNQQHYLHPKYLLLYNSDSALVANKIALLLPHQPTETKPQ